MTSKQRKKRQDKKKQYAANTDYYRKHASVSYRKNADAAMERAKSRRGSDLTSRKKKLEAQKLKILNNESYRIKNRITAQINTKRRMIEDKDYADRNRQQATMNKKRRLMEDEAFAEKNRKQARINTKRRLMEDEAYAGKNREMATINTKRRRKENKTCGQGNSKRAKLNSRKHTAHETRNKQQTHAKQKYWRRRARLLATGKERQIVFMLKQKMTEQSNMSLFDVDSIFAMAQYAEKKSIRTLKYQHTQMAQQVATAIAHTEHGNCSTAADLDAAFGHRQHTTSSECYYWEQMYHMFNCNEVIPIDHKGQAHIFPPVTMENNAAQSMPMVNDVEPDTDVVSQ